MRAFIFFLLLFTYTRIEAQNGDILQREIEKAMTYEVNMDTSKTTGWVIGCIDNDSTWIYGYGRISKTSTIKPDGNTIFEIGGASKIFTATAIHQLTEKNIVHYDSVVNTYLKPAQRFPLGNKITLLQLMTHTSGLQKLPEGFGMNEFDQDQPYLTYTEGELFKFLQSMDTADLKIGKYLYSHLNHSLLEIIIKNKGEYALLTQFEHSLNDTTCTHAQGYNPGQRPVPNWRFGETFHYSLGMHTNMVDILNFLKTHLSIKDSVHTQSFSTTQKSIFKTEIDKYTTIGKIWHILKVSKQVEVCLQSGATNGQSAFIALVPNTKTAVVILANSRLVQGRLGMLILKILNYNWKR
jgi:serine-type D-Ala-D-Ala carboxypeptidase/endopeptidase